MGRKINFFKKTNLVHSSRPHACCSAASARPRSGRRVRSLLSATVGVSQLREMVMAGWLLLDSRISTPNIALSSAKTRSQLAKSELPGFLLEKRWVSAPVFAQMGQVSGEVARNLFFQTAQVSKKVARNSDSGQSTRRCCPRRRRRSPP